MNRTTYLLLLLLLLLLIQQQHTPYMRNGRSLVFFIPGGTGAFIHQNTFGNRVLDQTREPNTIF